MAKPIKSFLSEKNLPFNSFQFHFEHWRSFRRPCGQRRIATLPKIVFEFLFWLNWIEFNSNLGIQNRTQSRIKEEAGYFIPRRHGIKLGIGGLWAQTSAPPYATFDP